MKILNLDLDFFQNDIVYGMQDNKRVDKEYTTAWTEEKLRNYLENNLNLNINKKIRGRIFEHHDEAFYFWRELIQQGKLKVPFDIVHIDAHTDFGFGGHAVQYITTEYLHLPIEEREYPENLIYDYEEYKINFTDYMLYAIACNWFQSIEFITHPKWNYNDLSRIYFKNYDYNSNIIQLKKYERGKVLNREFEMGKKFEDIIPVSYEKEIPIRVIKCENTLYDGKFDFVSLSISPGYTVEDCDKLKEIINEYIDEI